MQEVFGNPFGLKPSELHALERTYRRRVDAAGVVSPELARHLTEVSREISRQVGVLLDRDGDVATSSWATPALELPDIGRPRAGAGRLRGLRLVHTHLNGEPLTSDDLTDLALLRLDLVAAIEVHARRPAGGGPLRAPAARRTPHGRPVDGRGRAARARARLRALGGALALEDEFARARPLRATRRRASARSWSASAAGSRARAEAEASLEELRELARTAGRRGARRRRCSSGASPTRAT